MDSPDSNNANTKNNFPSNGKGSCVFCGIDDYIYKYNTSDIYGNQYTINKCNSCHACFLDFQGDKDRLNEIYDDSYYGEQEEKFSSSNVEKTLDFFRKHRAKRLSSFLRDNNNILDVGCGNGRFLMFLQEKGKYFIFGTELEGKAVKRASGIPGLKLKTGPLEKNDFNQDFFSAVTMFHVFEHLNNPMEVLKIISDIIKDDGIFMVSFPNISSIQSKLFKGKWLHLDPPRHLFYFAPGDFIKLMSSYGFKLIRYKTFSVEMNPFGMVQSILNCLFSKRDVLFERMKGNYKYGSNYSRLNIIFQKLFLAIGFPLFVVTDFLASLFKKGATVEYIFRKLD